MKSLKRLFAVFLLQIVFASPGINAETKQQKTQTKSDEAASPEHLARQIRKELVTLPQYTVFDNIEFKIEGSKVTLLGQATQPALKSEAEAAVKRIEGISSVDSQIEVLPVSPTDDELRLELFRAIYSSPMLLKYAIQAVPPIHIIVKNGHVTLEGVVATEAEKNQAELEASAVPGVFSVKNNLRVEKQAQAWKEKCASC